MADDVALRLGARDHLFHVTPPHPLQRLAGQHVDMPGLGVHRRRRAFCNLQDFLDHRPRHGLVLETAHALARLDQRLEFHCFLCFLRCFGRAVTNQDVDARVKPGHDGGAGVFRRTELAPSRFLLLCLRHRLHRHRHHLILRRHVDRLVTLACLHPLQHELMDQRVVRDQARLGAGNVETEKDFSLPAIPGIWRSSANIRAGARRRSSNCAPSP